MSIHNRPRSFRLEEEHSDVLVQREKVEYIVKQKRAHAVVYWTHSMAH